MDKRYKVTLTSKNLYKEIDLAPSMSQLKVGTAPECDIRIRKDLFFESIEMTFVKSGDQWSVVCSDNLYFSEGDVRKLITKNLNHGDEFVVKYQNSDGDILSVSFMLDFDYAEKAYDVCVDIAPLHCIVIGGKDGSQIRVTSPFVGNDSFTIENKGNSYILKYGKTQYGVYLNGKKTEKDVVLKDNDFISIADVSFCLASKEGNLLIDDKGNVYDNDIVIMSETEAEAMFALEEYDVEDGIAYLSINEYKGTEKNVKIPDVIYDENGNITKMITKINSFIPSVTPLYEAIYIDSDTYNEYNPIQIWNCVTDNKLPYPGDAEKDAIIKGKENNKAKYDKMVEHGLLGIVGLTEEDIILDNDYIPYLYIGEKGPIPIPEHTKIEKITISSNIIEIGTKAFLGQTALTEIKYKTPFGRPTIAEDAFDGCTSLKSIRFVGDDKWPFYYDHAGEGNPLPIEGYQTYWGAPNENVKIYDVDGTEVEI